MKFFIHYISFIIILTSNSSCAKGQPEPNTINRDSIINKYVVNGAWQYPITSKAWGEHIDSALYILPKDAYLWQQKAMPYFKQMKYEIGMNFLDSAVKYYMKRFIDYRAFIKCIFQKNYNAAKIDFYQAIRINGNVGVMDHPYEFYLGLCDLQLNHYNSAIIRFSNCINKEEEKAGSKWVHYLHYFYKGIAYFELEKDDSSVIYFDKSLALYSNFSDAKLYKAKCLAIHYHIEEALSLCLDAQNDLQKGYTINEDNSMYEKYPYQINKQLILLYLNNYRKAIEIKNSIEK